MTKTQSLTISKADIAVGKHVIQNIQRERRGLKEIEKLIFVVENMDQVLSERQRALDAINAEIDKREAATIDAAEAEGKRRGDALVVAARQRGEAIAAAAERERDEAVAVTEATRAEYNALVEKIEAAKATIAKVLSGA